MASLRPAHNCPQGLEFLTMTIIALTYFAGFAGFVTTMACVYGRKARSTEEV